VQAQDFLQAAGGAVPCIGRHVSGIADPFNSHIDEFRISHVQLDRDHLE
jgi:hypothetical protein